MPSPLREDGRIPLRHLLGEWEEVRSDDGSTLQTLHGAPRPLPPSHKGPYGQDQPLLHAGRQTMNKKQLEERMPIDSVVTCVDITGRRVYGTIVDHVFHRYESTASQILVEVDGVESLWCPRSWEVVAKPSETKEQLKEDIENKTMDKPKYYLILTSDEVLEVEEALEYNWSRLDEDCAMDPEDKSLDLRGPWKELGVKIDKLACQARKKTFTP